MRFRNTNKRRRIRFSIIAILFLSGFITGPVSGAKPSVSDNLAKGRELLEQGRYYQALTVLELSEKQAGTTEQRALATGALGLAHYQLRHDQEAEVLLRKAISTSTADSHEQARWNAMLAALLNDQNKQEEARRLFAKALELAEHDPKLTSGIELQQLEAFQPSDRLTGLTKIYNRLTKLKPSETRSSYLVRLATQAHQIGNDGKELAYHALLAAKSNASTRLLAEISGELAQLYEDDRRYTEALALNQTALDTIKKLDAPEIALELEWRQGRLYRNLNQLSQALAAYQKAIDHIETIRHDIPLTYRNGQSSFRITLEPLYQQTADLLLEQAKQQNDAAKIPLLRRARNVVELVKQAELEDFLGGRCAVQPVSRALVETIEPKTAVLYPIIMPDRLELIVSMGDQIRQFTSTVDKTTLRNAVKRFVGALRSGQPEEKTFSTPLYQWLIAPVHALLQQQNVQTLVIVPDSFLRLLPFAALHDGRNYLIERYAISTSPGLSIIEPSPIKPREVKSLIVGLSEPGNVINQLPETLVQELAAVSVRGISQPEPPKSRALPFIGFTEENSPPVPDLQREQHPYNNELRNTIKQVFSLPGVVTEIDQLAPTLPGTVLLNESFTVNRFRQELLQKPFAIVHVASHLIAGPNSASSFLMAHDDIINFDELERLFKTGKFANQPVEMLTLSACQTAEGDDRAPLGLSGIAIKAKVRSTLGTLWPVNDEAAPVLMVAFYQALNQPGVNKAQALRQAQRVLLAEKKFKHPFFWAPYLLVGNWL